MDIKRILEQHDLRKTTGRMAVLRTFGCSDKALSHSDLQKLLKGKVDRVTLYRILESFEEKGILHKVPDDEVSVKYGLCGHQHDVGHAHTDNHPHFKCHRCGDTLCLESSGIPAIETPNGFKVEDQFLLLAGVCARCVG